MELVKCVNQNSKLSIDHVNSFNNKTATVIGSKGLSIDLDDGTDLSRKIKQYIANGIVYIDKTPQAAPKSKTQAVNPFDKSASKVEPKAEPKSEPKGRAQTATKSEPKDEIKVDSSSSEVKENESKTNSRPTAKKK